MTGPGAPNPAETSDHPLRAALARGDSVYAESGPALAHLLTATDRSLITEAVVAQVRGMLRDMAGQVIGALTQPAPDETSLAVLLEALQAENELRLHCQALALEWTLTNRLQSEAGLDPVLSPQLQSWVTAAGAATGSLAMAALAAQARFVQARRRMELPLTELPAELLHLVLTVARAAMAGEGADAVSRADSRLRTGYDEAATRLSLLSRLASEVAAGPGKGATLEECGAALWLSVMAHRSGEPRDRLACATADPHLGRLLLTLRAAGVSAADAERQAAVIHPDANIPRGLGDVGTREAARWLAGVRE